MIDELKAEVERIKKGCRFEFLYYEHQKFKGVVHCGNKPFNGYIFVGDTQYCEDCKKELLTTLKCYKEFAENELEFWNNFYSGCSCEEYECSFCMMRLRKINQLNDIKQYCEEQEQEK